MVDSNKKRCFDCGSVDGLRFMHKFSKYVCGRHRWHMNKYGFIKHNTIQTPPKFTKKDDHYLVSIRDKQGRFKVNCKIDIESYELLKDCRFSCRYDGYVMVTNNRKRYRIGRFLLNPKRNEVVDHINHNPLDNRLSNLRIVSRSQNQHNRKNKPKRLFKRKDTGKWVVSIMVEGAVYKTQHETKKEAMMYRKELENRHIKKLFE